MDVARLCSELVKINSENPPGDTREVISYIRECTDSLGLQMRLVRNRGGKYNLLSKRITGNLLFLGHVDVVPALADGWDKDPISGAITGGRVYGRGSTDMKGGCAAILAACGEVLAAGGEVPADLTFVCDEETSGTQGIRSILARRLLSPFDCIIAEPTLPLSPNIGQKGLMRVRLTFSGEAGHGSLYPQQGDPGCDGGRVIRPIRSRAASALKGVLHHGGCSAGRRAAPSKRSAAGRPRRCG